MQIINYKIYVDSRYYTVHKSRKSFFKKVIVPGANHLQDKYASFFKNLDFIRLRVPEHITANKHLLLKLLYLIEPKFHQISLWYIRKISGYI